MRHVLKRIHSSSSSTSLVAENVEAPTPAREERERLDRHGKSKTRASSKPSRFNDGPSRALSSVRASASKYRKRQEQEETSGYQETENRADEFLWMKDLSIDDKTYRRLRNARDSVTHAHQHGMRLPGDESYWETQQAGAASQEGQGPDHPPYLASRLVHGFDRLHIASDDTQETFSSQNAFILPASVEERQKTLESLQGLVKEVEEKTAAFRSSDVNTMIGKLRDMNTKESKDLAKQLQTTQATVTGWKTKKKDRQIAGFIILEYMTKGEALVRNYIPDRYREADKQKRRDKGKGKGNGKRTGQSNGGGGSSSNWQESEVTYQKPAYDLTATAGAETEAAAETLAHDQRLREQENRWAGRGGGLFPYDAAMQGAYRFT